MKNLLTSFSNGIRFLAVVFLITAYGQTAYATGGDEVKKVKTPKQTQLTKEYEVAQNTDSLSNKKKEIVQKNDSTVSTQKTKTPSGASYNILFQVIYRNSLSEIFEESN